MSVFGIVTSDLQKAAANKHSERRLAVSRVLPGIAAFLRSMRDRRILIVHLQLVVGRDDPRSAGLPESLQFSEGSEGAELLPEIASPSDIVITKPKDSGFHGTALEDVLRSYGVTTVVLLGMQTQVCIQTTAADAHFRGFRVLVPEDGVTSTREEDTLRALEWMKEYCATVTSLSKVTEMIIG